MKSLRNATPDSDWYEADLDSTPEPEEQDERVRMDWMDDDPDSEEDPDAEEDAMQDWLASERF